MIDLYALTSPNVQKVVLMLEETALPYRTIPVDVWAGKQFDAEFKRLNPNAKIPVIVDSEGPNGRPYTVFESGAILMYLADKTAKFLPADKAARFDTIQWLIFQMASIGPMFGQSVHFSRFAPPGNDYAARRYRTEVRRLYEVLDTRLEQSQYLGCIDYTIADMASFPWARNYDLLGIARGDYPNVARWVESIGARPAVKRMQAQIDALQAKSSRDRASEDDRDRFFGRGRYARA
jgi:GST-like protein